MKDTVLPSQPQDATDPSETLREDFSGSTKTSDSNTDEPEPPPPLFSMAHELTEGLARGWSFTPLNGKRPILTDWPKLPPLTRDETLDHAEKRNMGLLTGQRSGVAVIDVDLGKGATIPDGLPQTWTVETGGGGLHFYYSVPDGSTIPNSTGKLADHVDVRGDGGQVVFVGSIHSDTEKRYDWQPGHAPGDLDLAPFPMDLLPQREPTRRSTEGPASPGNGHTHIAHQRYANAALEGECEKVRRAVKGTRNDTLNAAAFSIGGLLHTIDEESARNALTDAARDNDLPDHEIRSTITSGMSKGKQEPREIPASPMVAGQRRIEGAPKAANVLPIRNYEFVRVENGPRTENKKQALRLADISREVFDISDGWPKRVGAWLFVDEGGSIRFLASVDELFAYLGELAPLHWSKAEGIDGVQLTPKGEFRAHLNHVAEAYEQVENLPHEPEMDGFYYAWRAPTNYEPTGECLDTLCGFFDNYETEHDRVLIRAMFLTLFWGGLPGTRPAFAIMANDRGCGKSVLKDIAKTLGGGTDIEPNGRNEDKVITRLLSEDILLARMVGVDNIKGGASSALLESLITATSIDGHRMYKGNASRPNTLTFILTGNTLRLSRDMAERCLFIRLKKPTPNKTWRDDVFAYVREHSERIIADAIHILRGEATQHGARDRWQPWIEGVLARSCDNPEGVVALNQARRDDCDTAIEEAESILATLHKWREGGEAEHGPEFDPNFINGTLLASLVSTALRVDMSTRGLANKVREHSEAGRLTGVKKKDRRGQRGYEIGDIGDACDTCDA